MRVAANITRARKAAGLNKAQLAVLVKVTRGAVSQWENGDVTPTLKRLRVIARVTKTPITKLVGGA